ncbi:MAG: hydrolase TatD [Candidatus Kerfeldbacteria bacterium CG15_BIG_FIL_POST_REV_8_21_14_020_45_12]|uniref:Hydrolase TatD n=1 Tax=Candidatus Kerfeldbacteria bacterium CG15_BIG_FIL_POST_REV_8_21_14_020_45_12 TaxID=2014247 RepID=A0A2M7H4I3_9BACT|nr:MAG: hydrolase TatD [Candidatus Kerfeldbacteria bacterium CG15_BIG_FIL_POST_REV_8_21_14_020_45_12]PJA92940.1 MAG: hydrolase TatD [Candidatus Kerfeldbacteria bacterium CG_4_9_14_3_um_filter_45_8]
MKFVDTHAHVNFRAFSEDADQVIQTALVSGVNMINVGTNFATSQRSVEIAERTPGMWAAIGLHPIHLAKDITETAKFSGEEYSFTTKSELFDKRKFFELAQSPSVVAVGESGLDYFHLEDFKHPDMTAEQFVERQKETLYEILGFAREIERPHIFHCRDAYDEFADIVRQFGDNSDGGSVGAGVRGVVHCFTGSWEQAEKLLELGLYIGFTGIVTFPNAQSLQDIARRVPLDRLLIETDSPYLAPQAVRGQRNEPSHVIHVAEKIAELKGLSLEEVALATTQNAISLFQLPLTI